MPIGELYRSLTPPTRTHSAGDRYCPTDSGTVLAFLNARDEAPLDRHNQSHFSPDSREHETCLRHNFHRESAQNVDMKTGFSHLNLLTQCHTVSHHSKSYEDVNKFFANSNLGHAIVSCDQPFVSCDRARSLLALSASLVMLLSTGLPVQRSSPHSPRRSGIASHELQTCPARPLPTRLRLGMILQTHLTSTRAEGGR